MPHDVRDEIVDYVAKWKKRAELPAKQLVQWIGLGSSKFYDWKQHYGKVNEHNALVPRDHWLEAWEKLAIVAFHTEHPLDGYRRLTYLMMDQDVVAASPATVYRVLAQHGCFDRWNRTESKKGIGFQQPLQPHEHWHVDILKWTPLFGQPTGLFKMQLLGLRPVGPLPGPARPVSSVPTLSTV